MIDKRKFYINGKWVNPTINNDLEIINEEMNELVTNSDFLAESEGLKKDMVAISSKLLNFQANINRTMNQTKKENLSLTTDLQKKFNAQSSIINEVVGKNDRFYPFIESCS